MKRERLSPELVAAGVRQGEGAAPETITLEWLLAQNAKLERILRLQYEDDRLPEEWEDELRILSPENTTRQLQRWAFLKHCYRVRSDRLVAEEEGAPSKEEVARQLLRREPIVVWLGRHRVEVTGRSYSAMAEIAAHDHQIRKLEQDLLEASRLVAETRRRLAMTSIFDRRGRAHLRRRLKMLTDLHLRIYGEREAHRRDLYAHALTSHGGPATAPANEAPAWWREMGPEDDARLLVALFEAGPARYRKLGRPPSKPHDRKAPRFAEQFGFANLFAAWEKADVSPAELYDRDLAQTLTAMRAGAREFPERS